MHMKELSNGNDDINQIVEMREEKKCVKMAQKCRNPSSRPTYSTYTPNIF